MRYLQIGKFLPSMQEIIPIASKYLYLENIWCFAAIAVLCALCSKWHLIYKQLEWSPGDAPSGSTSVEWSQCGMECSGRAAERPLFQSPWCPLTMRVMPSPAIPYDSQRETLAETQLSHPSQLQKHDPGCWVKGVLTYRFAPLETVDYSPVTD